MAIKQSLLGLVLALAPLQKSNCDPEVNSQYLQARYGVAFEGNDPYFPGLTNRGYLLEHIVHRGDEYFTLIRVKDKPEYELLRMKDGVVSNVGSASPVEVGNVMMDGGTKTVSFMYEGKKAEIDFVAKRRGEVEFRHGGKKGTLSYRKRG